MKGLLRVYVFYLLALWFVAQLLGDSFQISGKAEQILLAAAVLALLNLLLKPILKLIFFPVNVLTLGLFSLVINTAVFYLFVRLMPGVTITPWLFPGVSLPGAEIGPYQLSFIATLFVASLITSVITNFFYFLVK